MSSLKIVTWKITGVRPLMQTNYVATMSLDTETKEGAKKKAPAVRLKPFDEAKRQLYETDGAHWHPSLSFWRSMLDHCTGYKIGGAAASTMVPRIVYPIDGQEFILCDPNTLDDDVPTPIAADAWQMDSRRVVNEKKGALIVHRPKWPKWGGLLSFECDLEGFEGKKERGVLDAITGLLNVSGRYGIGAGRLRFDEKRKRWGGLGLGKFSAELRT